MGWEMSLEPQPPPYAAFGHRRPTTTTGVTEGLAAAFSPLLDPRLRELHLSRLKCADEALERRKRLAERSRNRWRPPTDPAAGGKDQGGRGKGADGK